MILNVFRERCPSANVRQKQYGGRRFWNETDIIVYNIFFIRNYVSGGHGDWTSAFSSILLLEVLRETQFWGKIIKPYLQTMRMAAMLFELTLTYGKCQSTGLLLSGVYILFLKFVVDSYSVFFFQIPVN